MERFLLIICFGIVAAISLAAPLGPAAVASSHETVFVSNVVCGHTASALAQIKDDEETEDDATIDWDAILEQIVEWFGFFLSYFVVYLDAMIDFITALADTTST